MLIAKSSASNKIFDGLVFAQSQLNFDLMKIMKIMFWANKFVRPIFGKNQFGVKTRETSLNKNMTSNKVDQFGRQYTGTERLTQLISCLSLPRKHDLLKQGMF